jgi:hypothetical protein
MTGYSSPERRENDRKHYETHGKRLIQHFKLPVDCVRNSRVGKTAEHIKDEITCSIAIQNQALKNPETRKRWFFNKALQFTPEILTGLYLVGYAIADHNYYSNRILTDLSRTGSAVKGTILVPWSSAPIPNQQSDGFIHWNPDNTRPLYPVIEDRIGGAAIGLIPDVMYRIYKGVKHLKKASQGRAVFGKRAGHAPSRN